MSNGLDYQLGPDYQLAFGNSVCRPRIPTFETCVTSMLYIPKSSITLPVIR